MKTTLMRLVLRLFTLALLSQFTPVLAQDGCTALTSEVSFCYGAANMVPFDVDGEEWYHSPDKTLIAWFSIHAPVSDRISDTQLLNALLKSDALAMGVPYGDLEIVSPMREVDFNGHAGMEAYYFAPAGMGGSDPNDRVMGRTIVNLPSGLITMNTLEYGYYPSPKHVLAALAMRQAFRVGPQEDVPQSDMAATTACDELVSGVTLCGIHDLAPSSYRILPSGEVQITIGDANVNVSAARFGDDLSSMSESERFDRQKESHNIILGKWLKSRGTEPSDVAVDMMLRFPSGDGPAESSRNAYTETYFIDDGDGVNTHAMTVLLGSNAMVLILSNNPGQGASEDHFFLLEEVLRGLRLP